MIRCFHVVLLRPATWIGTANCTNGLREGIVEAGIPMDNDDDVHDQIGDAKGIGVVCPGLRPLEKLQHPETNKHVLTLCSLKKNSGKCLVSDIPIEAEQLVQADLWVLDAKNSIENVSGDH